MLSERIYPKRGYFLAQVFRYDPALLLACFPKWFLPYWQPAPRCHEHLQQLLRTLPIYHERPQESRKISLNPEAYQYPDHIDTQQECTHATTQAASEDENECVEDERECQWGIEEQQETVV